ncbi:MAG: tyrosine-protein phosphatase [Methanobacteriota archaeon]
MGHEEEYVEELPGNFRWFDDQEQVAGSAVPFGEDLKPLEWHGIETVISFIPDHEFPDTEVFADMLGKTKIEHFTFEIPNMGVPTPEQRDEFIGVVNDSLGRGKVLLHCVGGKGRTGTMAGLLLLHEGVPFDEMLKRVRYVESADQLNALVTYARDLGQEIDDGLMVGLRRDFIDVYGPKGRRKVKV